MKKGFTEKQEVALAVLQTTPNIAEAARISGLARSTLHRFLSVPEFKAELFRRKSEQLEEGTAVLRSGLKDSAEELLRIIRKDSASDQVKINAINTLLAYTARYSELVDIVGRLDELSSIHANNKAIDPMWRGEHNEE